MKIFEHTQIEFEELPTVTEDGKRFYKTPDGILYPSVTTITSQMGKDSILAWRKRVGEAEANKISTQASSRGTRMHGICEDYLCNKQFKSSIMPDAMAMFKSIQPILDECIDDVHAIEAPLYSHHLRVAGRVDCVAKYNGKLSIIDWKTSSKQKDEKWILNYFMQCSAYAVMFEERTSIPVSQLVVIIAVAGDNPQVFVKKRNDYIRYFIEYRNLYDTQNGKRNNE
jgi:genome maintenance exonuclease 1